MTAIELQTVDLCKSFNGREVLRRITLTVRAGELVAVVGASGSGKTVLLSLLTGLLPPSSGRVLAADHNAADPAEGEAALVDLGTAGQEALDRIRLHWAIVFQRNALFSGTVRENLALWLREHTGLSAYEIERRSRAALHSVALDVDDVLGKPRDALSGGMAKRVAIARAVACDPLVMFYDEPTTGLDPMVGSAIHDLIWSTHNRPAGTGFELRDLEGDQRAAMAARAGTPRTSIIVTHDRDLLRRLRPRTIMLHDGRVCYDGPYEGFGQPDCPPAEAYLRQMPVLHGREPQ